MQASADAAQRGRIRQAQAQAGDQGAAEGVTGAGGVHGIHGEARLQQVLAAHPRAAAARAEGDHHGGGVQCVEAGADALPAADRRQLAFVDDQQLAVAQQAARQGLRRCGVERHLYTGAACFPRPGFHRRQGRFQLQQQMADIGQRRQMFGQQPRIGAGRHGDRVLAVARQADEGDAGGRAAHAHDVEPDAGPAQRGFDRRRMHVVAQGQQYPRGRAAGPHAGHRLVGALAAGKGGEAVAEHGFARRRHVRRAHHEIEIGRAGHQHAALHGCSAW
ncbi:hypothetical protein FHW85_003899 [Dyella sp. SG609]|nr:hypothetical protein [Dyella sp. SG609]